MTPHPTRLRAIVDTLALAARAPREGLQPPKRSLSLRELGVGPRVAGALLRRPPRAPGCDGNSHPVMLVPGFGAGEWSMGFLARTLERHGFLTTPWGLGTNGGDVPALAPQVTDQARAFADARGEAITLVGWSLGGYFSREAARDLPDEVAQVITLGTPAWGGPKYTAAAGFYTGQGLDLDEIENGTFERFERPIEQPIVAFWSRRDGVVSWECCIDHWSPNVEHVEVDCTHVGLGFDRDIALDLTRRLCGLLEKTEQEHNA
ncbi:MAG: alpha/beta fold hydrolase [Pseudomonadota bacterium]